MHRGFSLNVGGITRVVWASLWIAFPSTDLLGQAVRTRQLGPIIIGSSESIRFPAVVRGLASGGVLVNEVLRRRVVLLDERLRIVRVVIDSGATSVSEALIAARGDSSLYVDWDARAVVAIGPDGKIGHSAALPSSQISPADFSVVARHNPAMDSKGRLLYSGRFAPQAIPTTARYAPAVRLSVSEPDSAPLIRVDFDTRVVDTIAVLKIGVEHKTLSVEPTGNGNFLQTVRYNPMPKFEDDWAVLSDGSVAIVRAKDYHIDWIAPNGERKSSGKMEMAWRRLSDQSKDSMLVAFRQELDRVNGPSRSPSADLPSAPGVAPRLIRKFELPPLSEIPDYTPPFVRGTLVADLDGNIWIPPRTTYDLAPGLLYDVVNTKGIISERVRLPSGRVIAGFLPGGLVILKTFADGTSRLEIAQNK